MFERNSHCDTCNVSFFDKSTLRMHIKRLHGGPIKCRLCYLMIQDKYYLREAIVKIHNFEESQKRGAVTKISYNFFMDMSWVGLVMIFF